MAEVVPSNIALWKPFANKGTTLLRRDIVCVHTMVGSLAGSYSWASGTGRSYWHFGISGTGECWQCQDLQFRSAANLEGNPYVIPIETADMGPGFEPWNGQCGNVPAFTTGQIDKLVQLIAYLCVRYAIPPVFIPDTRAGRRGIAWHRQGIPGWPEWQGGLLWSSSAGKCCPDNAKINQLKTIIVPRVQSLVNGDDDMPTLNEVGDEVDRRLAKFAGKRWVSPDTVPAALTLSEFLGKANHVGYPKIAADLAAVREAISELAAVLEAIPEAVWQSVVTSNYGSARTTLRDTRTIARRTEQAVEALGGDTPPS